MVATATIEQAIRDAMAGDAALAAIVGDRIYPVTLPQGATLPALTYERLAGEHPVLYSGPQDLAAVRLQVEVWATRFAEIVAATDALVRLFHGYNAALGPYAAVSGRLVTSIDTYEPAISGFVRALEFAFQYAKE